MKQTAIFLPLISMITLTFVVMIIMALRRANAVRRRGLSVNQLPGTRQEQTNQPEGPLWDRRTAAAGDHFANLFETPILFYFLCMALFATESVTKTVMIIAWTYVGLRAIHAFIHLTYNLVGHRFTAFTFSILMLIALTCILFTTIA